MGRFRRGARLGAVVVTLSLFALPTTAARAAAPLCAYDTAARVLTVTAITSVVTIEAGGIWLVVNDTNCALLAEVNTVNVNMGGFANTVLIFDLAGGPFGPGFTDEGNGSSEIEFDVTGFGSGSALTVLGSGGADGVAVGQRLNAMTGLIVDQFNLNSIADGATKDTDVTVHGSPGGIRLEGKGGNDVLSGAGTGVIGARAYPKKIIFDDGSGGDDVLGGSGDDLLLIDVGAKDQGDDYAGGAGTDTVLLNSSLSGSSPYINLNDVSDDGLGCPNTIRCEADNYASDIELILGSHLPERIVGGPGSQEISGGGGDDEIDGGGGDDHISGGIGADSLKGGPGDDTLIGGHGPDVINGGGGIDTVDYSAANDSVSVNLNAVADDGMNAEGDYIATNVERAVGSSHDDEFLGTAADNVFRGRDGNDLFYGKRGDDELYGGKGDDHFWGGKGNDLCAQGPGTGPKKSCER
jgi:Ca2+-binding RTX toxin-like protein